MKTAEFLPELPLVEWEKSKITLHLFLQIIGKVRLKMMPRKNHWWFITEYISHKGITTQSIPYEEGTQSFEICLNFIRHQLEIETSKGEFRSFVLENGLSVADFYTRLFALLEELGIRVKIYDQPFDMQINKRFTEINEHHTYQKEYIERFWQILRWVDSVLNEFSGRFYGKTCPVHLYWHHMDLTVTRFSGNKGPALPPGMRLSDKDAYSHEVISFGFWAGDDNIRQPTFYAYAYPSPPDLEKQVLLPASARWVDSNGSPMALLYYDDLRQEAQPRESLLNFLESAYQAGASLAGWDKDLFFCPELDQL